MTTALRRRSAVHALVSQAANSGGNLLLAVMVAREVGTADFGAWSVGYAGYLVALAVTRALVCTPLLLTRARQPRELDGAVAAGSGLAILIGLAGSVCLLLVGLAAPRLAPAMLAFAACLPILLLQDALRHGSFAAERPRVAAVLDLSWLVLQCAGFAVVLLGIGGGSVFVLTLVWGLSALPAMAARVLAMPPLGVSGARSFWLRNKSDGVKLLADSALATAATQALPVVVAAASGLAAAGALRGGLTLLGVVNILVAGLTPVATLAARRQYDAGRGLVPFVGQWTLVLLLVSAANGVLLLLLPESVGRAVLGETWEAASLLLVPLVLHSLVRGPFTGVPIALRASGRVGDALRLRAWTMLPTIGLPWAGALLLGVQGAVWGIFLSALVADLIALAALRSRVGQEAS